MDNHERFKLGERAAWISIAAYIILAAVKVSIALWYHSDALLADGLNNSTDIIASVAILIGLRISSKPPDRDHRYGHSRAETVASLVASLIIAAVGVQVIFETASSILKGSHQIVPNMLTAWTALGCAVFIFIVHMYNLRLAKLTNSQAVRAAAMDNRSDALVSIGVFAGILGAQFGMPWLDPLAAFIVGLIICKTAWDIFRESTHHLTDGFDEALLQEYKKTIGGSPGVRSIKNIRARIHGNIILVDAVICLKDENLNVRESHRLTEIIEQRMRDEHRVEEVHIHIEPR